MTTDPKDPTLLEAVSYLLELRDASQSFGAFVRFMHPKFKIPKFHDEIIEALDALEKGTLGKHKLMLNMPVRHGKQISDDTKILTPSGWRTHGDIHPGDTVFHPSGKPIKVLAVSKKTMATLEIEFTTGEKIKCHPNHEWTVYHRGMNKEITVETSWFTSKVSRNASTKDGARALQSGGRNIFILPKQNPIQFNDAVLPIEPYTFGAWLGDGTSEAGVICSSIPDMETIKKCAALSGAPTSSWQHKDTKVQYQLFPGLKAKLRAVGVYKNKHIPDLYKFSSISQRLDLLAGLIDTDGHVDGARVRIVTSSKNLANDILEIVRGLGMSGGISTAVTSEHKYKGKIIKGGTEIFSVSFSGSPDIPCALERKKIKKITRRERSAAIKSIKPCAPVPGNCIQVDSPDGLYLVGETLIPTHNSWLVSTCFPIYYMSRKPQRKILASSYSAELANTIGKDARNLIQDPLINKIFPHCSLATDSQAANDWRTTEGGKYFACGLDGSTSGRPANLLLWDDLLKNREAADSPTQRNKAWSHYVSALVKRLEPEIDNTPAIEVGVGTRWHPDDPFGRLIDSADYKDGDWHHIVFRGETSDPITHAPCALWPERFPLEYLEKQKRLDPAEFSALYQQEPFIKGGNIIKETWWRTYTKEERPTTFSSVIIAVDTAFKDTETSDYSVFLVMGMSDSGDLYILDIVRDRMEYPELKRRLLILNSIWRGKALRAIHVEDKASGQSLIQELRRTPGLSVIPVKVQRDKVSRLNAVAPLIEGGRVFIPTEAPWLDDFLNETSAFPSSKHDDQVDALTMALDIMSRMSVTNIDMLNSPLEMSSSLHNQFSNVIPLADKFKHLRSWGE